ILISPLKSARLKPMDSEVGDWCSVLELTGVIDEITVKAAYRKQIRLWHPDRHHEDPINRAIAERRSKLINHAYECLTEAIETRGCLGSVHTPSTAGTGTASGSTRSSARHVYRTKPFKPGFPDAAVFEVFVKSSNILSLGYSQHTRTLYVKFNDGAIYR